MRAARWWVLLPLGLAAGTAGAYDVETIDVTRRDARYRVEMRVTLDVAASAAYAVFSDSSRLPEINPAVKKVTVLPNAPEGLERIYTKVRVCVSFFCHELEQVQDMRTETMPMGGWTIHADVIPALSNLNFGVADWEMRDCGGKTCLHFVAELEPKFWVPPLIGPWLMQRKLREEAMQTSAGIERLARTEAGAASPAS